MPFCLKQMFLFWQHQSSGQFRGEIYKVDAGSNGHSYPHTLAAAFIKECSEVLVSVSFLTYQDHFELFRTTLLTIVKHSLYTQGNGVIFGIWQSFSQSQGTVFQIRFKTNHYFFLAIKILTIIEKLPIFWYKITSQGITLHM